MQSTWHTVCVVKKFDVQRAWFIFLPEFALVHTLVVNQVEIHVTHISSFSLGTYVLLVINVEC